MYLCYQRKAIILSICQNSNFYFIVSCLVDNISKLRVNIFAGSSGPKYLGEDSTLDVYYQVVGYPQNLTLYISHMNSDSESDMERVTTIISCHTLFSNEIVKLELKIKNIQTSDIGFYLIDIDSPNGISFQTSFSPLYIATFDIKQSGVYHVTSLNEQTNWETNKAVTDRLWKYDEDYSIYCIVEGTNLLPFEFKHFQKSCLLKESCNWTSVIENRRIGWKTKYNGNITTLATNMTYTLTVSAESSRNSYRITYHNKTCVETDYYPTERGYGIENVSSPFYVSQNLTLRCFFDLDYLYFKAWKINFNNGSEIIIFQNNAINWVIKESYDNFEMELYETYMDLYNYYGYSILSASNITSKYDGNYTCLLAQRSDFNITPTFPTYNLHVLVPHPPYFENASNEYIEVKFGESYNLNCDGFNGDPKPTVQWFNEKNNSVHNGSIYSAIHFNSISYRCEIKNDFGSKSKYFHLSVLQTNHMNLAALLSVVITIPFIAALVVMALKLRDRVIYFFNFKMKTFRKYSLSYRRKLWT